MNEFDIIFKGQHGSFTLNKAKKWPTKEELENALPDLQEAGIGEVQEITIKLRK